MKLWDPRTWFGNEQTEVKVSAAGRIMVPFGVGQPVWTPRNYDKLSQEAYVVNAIGFRCMKLIAACATAPKLVLRGRGGAAIEEHPLLDLINRPSAWHSGRFLFESIYTYLYLAGNTYMESVGPSREEAPPAELWSHRPDRMRVIAGPFGVPSAYEYFLAGKTKRWPVSIRGESKILHIKEFHPTEDWYGLSRVEPGAYGVDRHNSSSKHNKYLVDNGARPSGALVFEPIKSPDGESMVSAPAEVLEAAEKELMKRHTGTEHAGKPFVFGGNVKWEEMAWSPRDMDFDVSKQDAARDICAAWGVPHVLVVKGEATYNNVREAKLELHEDTILPLIEHVLGEINNWLPPMFGEELKLEVDLDSISALELRRNVRREAYRGLVNDGLLSINEGREALGYGPREPDTVSAVDANVLKTLVELSAAVGITPLRRYLIATGLVEPETTDEDLIASALDLIEDDEGEGEPGEEDDNDDEE